jgi:hypothetical protein
MHFAISLPTSIANGAKKREEWEDEVIPLVGGGEVRNELWSRPLRFYELPYPAMVETDPVRAAIRNVWRTTGGGTHTFDFYDEEDEELVRVRFDSDLEWAGEQGPFGRPGVIALREDRG